MSRKLLISCFFAAASLAICAAATLAEGWQGVDDTVVGKFAEQAGHPARHAYINTDQGDLLLFVFLIAGIVGGFVMGYAYRGLFAKPKAASR